MSLILEEDNWSPSEKKWSVTYLIVSRLALVSSLVSSPESSLSVTCLEYLFWTLRMLSLRQLPFILSVFYYQIRNFDVQITLCYNLFGRLIEPVPKLPYPILMGNIRLLYWGTEVKETKLPLHSVNFFLTPPASFSLNSLVTLGIGT